MFHRWRGTTGRGLGFQRGGRNVSDSYSDGALIGAAIGIIDARGTLRSTQALHLASSGRPFGGYGRRRFELTMVTDADDPAIVSQLLSAKLSAIGAG